MTRSFPQSMRLGAAGRTLQPDKHMSRDLQRAKGATSLVPGPRDVVKSCVKKRAKGARQSAHHVNDSRGT